MSQQQNLEIAQKLLASLVRNDSPEIVAAFFADDLEFEVPGFIGALPWIGRRKGNAAVADFVRDSARLMDRMKFEVQDILANDSKVVILGELASKLKANSKVIETAFALVLTIVNGKISHFRMLEDSFAVSQATLAS